MATRIRELKYGAGLEKSNFGARAVVYRIKLGFLCQQSLWEILTDNLSQIAYIDCSGASKHVEVVALLSSRTC